MLYTLNVSDKIGCNRFATTYGGRMLNVCPIEREKLLRSYN